MEVRSLSQHPLKQEVAEPGLYASLSHPDFQALWDYVEHGPRGRQLVYFAWPLGTCVSPCSLPSLLSILSSSLPIGRTLSILNSLDS